MLTKEVQKESSTAKPNGVAPRVEQYREKAVDALHEGADTARVLGRRSNKLGRRAGEGLDYAADYIETYDVARAPRDVGHWLKKHPGPILAAAAFVGFFFARSLRR